MPQLYHALATTTLNANKPRALQARYATRNIGAHPGNAVARMMLNFCRGLLLCVCVIAVTDALLVSQILSRGELAMPKHAHLYQETEDVSGC